MSDWNCSSLLQVCGVRFKLSTTSKVRITNPALQFFVHCVLGQHYVIGA